MFSKYKFFNKSVFPHPLGPDNIYLESSGGNIAFTIILSSSNHDCSLSLTINHKIDILLMVKQIQRFLVNQDQRSFVNQGLLLHQQVWGFCHNHNHIHIVSRVYLFVWLGKGEPCWCNKAEGPYTNQGLRPFYES